MWTKRRWRSRLGRIVLPIVTLVVCAYFAHHSLSGPNGWHARTEHMRERDRLLSELDDLQTRNEALARRAALLNGDVLDRDALDEQVRDALGMARADEIVVMVPAER